MATSHGAILLQTCEVVQFESFVTNADSRRGIIALQRIMKRSLAQAVFFFSAKSGFLTAHSFSEKEKNDALRD